MPEQMEREVVAVDAVLRTWEKANGETGRAWTCKFKTPEGHEVECDTFSENAAKAIEEHKGKKVKVVVEQAKDKEGKPKTFRDKPVMNLVKLFDEKGTVLYEPGAKGGRGKGGYSQRPDWTYQDPAEREAERRSIEAQVAEKVTAEYFTALVQYSSDPELVTVQGALSFAEKMSDAVRGRIKKAATEKSGSGSRGSGRAAGGKGSAPADSGASEAPPPAPEPSVPTPEPDSSADKELADAKNAAVDLYGTPKKVEHAWAAAHDGEVKKFAELTAAELMELVVAAPAKDQAAATAGGW